MKITKILSVILVLCLTLTMFFSCDSEKRDTKKSKKNGNSEVKVECEHNYKDGYCTKCEEMDPSCTELTPSNYEDYIGITYKMANVDGSTGGSYGFVAFPYLYLSTVPTSSRITFYDVTIELEITVKQCLYPDMNYEACTVTAKINVSLFGDGDVEVRLERESSDPVLLKSSYISDYKIKSVTGCVSVD